MYCFPNLEPVHCSKSGSDCCFLNCVQVSQETGNVVWYFLLFKNFPQLVVIYTVKGRSVLKCKYIFFFNHLTGNPFSGVQQRGFGGRVKIDQGYCGVDKQTLVILEKKLQELHVSKCLRYTQSDDIAKRYVLSMNVYTLRKTQLFSANGIMFPVKFDCFMFFSHLINTGVEN